MRLTSVTNSAHRHDTGKLIALLDVSDEEAALADAEAGADAEAEPDLHLP